jgi:hypothetical protein
MTFVVALTQGEPAQRDSLIAAIRGLESDDAVVVDGDGNRRVVYLEIKSCSDIDAAARRAIEIVAVAGVAANTTFHVATGDLSWPPVRRRPYGWPRRVALRGSIPARLSGA